MIDISNALNEYLNKTTRLEGQYIRAEIKTKSGVKYIISDDEFSGGTVKIEKKSVSGSSFDIGECYINNATITIIDKENKYSENFNNAELSLFFGVKNASLKLDEEIQLGKFIIPTDTTIRKIASIQLVGDSMLSKFDVSTNGVATSGKPYALVSWCCDICGVELALTEAEFNALSKNTSYTFYISEDSAIETYRDIIMYVSQIIGGFATDTNDGKLTFKTYNVSNSTFNINNDTIASSKLGDSSYKLDGMTIQYNNKVLYIHGDSNSVYTLDLESNPLFDKLDEELVVTICNNIWLNLSDLTFRGFDFQYNGNPAIECGDILSNDVRGFSSFITSLSWVYHGKSSVVGAALDKRTKTKSQSVKKAASTGGSGGSSNELSIIRYINTEEFKLNTLETKVLQEYFNVPANVAPLFSFVMITKNELTGLISLRIVYDNVEVLLKPRYQCSLGYHTLSFTKSLDQTDVDMLHSLSIYATFKEDSGQSIEALTPCLVGAYDIEANIMGCKLSSGKPEWTGRYELTDEVSLVTFDNVINVLGFTEQASAGWSEKPKYLELTATEAVLHGTAVLRSNSEAKAGKDIDFIDTYPDNVAEFDFTLSDPVSATITFKAASNGGRCFNIYIDDTLVKTDLRVDSGSWTTGKIYNVVSNHSFTKGAHTVKFARGSGSYSPLLDYVLIDWR